MYVHVHMYMYVHVHAYLGHVLGGGTKGKVFMLNVSLCFPLAFTSPPVAIMLTPKNQNAALIMMPFSRQPAQQMINEVEAAIHHSCGFRFTQYRIALSATQFAHKSAVLGPFETQEIKPHNPSHQLYADISVTCSLTSAPWVLLIKTGIQ